MLSGSGFSHRFALISSRAEQRAAYSTCTDVQELERQIQLWHRQSEASRKLEAIPGIGPITASAIVASVGDAKEFKNGRQLAAWLGLVPKQSSSGGKHALLGISKRGDTYLRTLLIHGARSVIRFAQNIMDGLECVGPLKMADDVVTERVDVSSGSLVLPCGPGLGLSLDEAKVRRYCFDGAAPVWCPARMTRWPCYCGSIFASAAIFSYFSISDLKYAWNFSNGRGVTSKP